MISLLALVQKNMEAEPAKEGQDIRSGSQANERCFVHFRYEPY